MAAILVRFSNDSIEMSIVGGSLLGALRHGGFVPHDDDVAARPGVIRWVCGSPEIRIHQWFKRNGGVSPKIGLGIASSYEPSTISGLWIS
jgi:hypothetical protein